MERRKGKKPLTFSCLYFPLLRASGEVGRESSTCHTGGWEDSGCYGGVGQEGSAYHGRLGGRVACVTGGWAGEG